MYSTCTYTALGTSLIHVHETESLVPLSTLTQLDPSPVAGGRYQRFGKPIARRLFITLVRVRPRTIHTDLIYHHTSPAVPGIVPQLRQLVSYQET